MWELNLFLLLVFITSAPLGGNTQNVNTQTNLFITDLVSNAQNSKIVRFYGNSYIRYDFTPLTRDMLQATRNESLTFQFITQDTEGLLMAFNTGGPGKNIVIGIKNGYLLFLNDYGTDTQRVLLQRSEMNPVNDFRWHSLRMERFNRQLQFYVDNELITSLTAANDIQLIAPGDMYLGGSPRLSEHTNGRITSNFDGAITDVTVTKMTDQKNLIISFLSPNKFDSEGDIDFFDKRDWYNVTWIRPVTTKTPPTRAPEIPTPITFISGNSAFFLRDPIDMRNGGSIGFRFRTLEPRGLLAIARSAASGINFLAMEIFDGLLYFVSDLGTFSTRKTFSARRVDDGEWHAVKMTVQGNQILLTLDERTIPFNLPQSDVGKLFFYRIFVGGYDDFRRLPWPLYSRQGYKGCLELMQVNDIGVNLHNYLSGATGIEIGCRTFSRMCQTQPCLRGYCRDRMDGFDCECSSTPYTGQNCDENAPIAGMDGTKRVSYLFNNRQVTHTNDISLRFLTPLSNTFLFSTKVGNSDDYIKAELENGKVKVTTQVGGRVKTYVTGENLNDYFWHTLNIRRRADDIEVQVDDNPKMVGLLGSKDFTINVDELILGSESNTGAHMANRYIGYLQNLQFNNLDIFSTLKGQGADVYWIVNQPADNLPLLTYNPITVTSSNTFLQLPTMRIGLTMKILFRFKTREPNGMLLYNAGAGNDVIAVELSNGKVRLVYNLGGQNMFAVVPSKEPLNDNEWHSVQISMSETGQISMKVDDLSVDMTASDGNKRLDLIGNLYIAGLPEGMFQQREVRNLLESRQGFRGCLASMDLNGAVPDLIGAARDKQYVMNGCNDVAMTCIPNACGAGTCIPGINTYICDCNMTGYIGSPCTAEPIGYYFGKKGGKGIILYEFPLEKQTNSAEDMIAFGFMTREENGVLYRMESSLGNEYIEIRLEGGNIVAESNTGTSVIRVDEVKGGPFNDGQYHVVRYIRSGSNSTLQVDNLPMQVINHSGQLSLFDKVYRVLIGGKKEASGAQVNNFYGIVGGVHYNGYRWLDMLKEGTSLHGKLVTIEGDVVLTKPYILVDVPKTTAAPPSIYIPPDPEIDLTGIGVVGEPVGGGGGGAGGGGLIGIGQPGGGLDIIGGVGINVPGSGGPLSETVALAGPGLPMMATGARAGAVVGTVLGTMAFLTSLMWALYKLKPGVPTCLSPGAGSAGGGAGSMSISSPRASSNLAAVQAASAGAGSGGGAGGGGAGGSASKLTVVNGSAAGAGGGAGGGGGSSTYTQFFQSTSTAVGGGGAGGGSGGGAGGGAADNIDSANLRATGTFSNRGTAIGSPTATRAHLGSSSTNYSASNYQSNTMQSYGSSGGGGTFDRQYMMRAGDDGIPDYDLPVGSGGMGTMTSGYSSSTLNTHYNYQVQNLKTVTLNRQGQYMMTSGSTGGAVTPGAASDEVRVDCCLMAGGGRTVVTGSSLGPPQVWDMQTGELQNIMKGDTVGSTDLHLVCGDRLLVGAVHADMEINEYSSRKGVFNHSLQIWDFQTGKPLAMAEGEYCSALCPMSDNDKVLFGRTDKYGDATSIIVWDLMGNQMVKEMRYDTPVGNNDYISYLKLSKNDRFVVAGFVNSFDNYAEFVVFDMTLTSYNIGEPVILKLDANPEVTAILPKDEAVTGLRNGDLVIWSIRTGQPSRQLLGSGGSHAHSREVKTVALSEDGKYLVSGSADGTLKVWDMHTERPIHTLAGHADEVWCSAISPDNEIVVSGSSDGTIRLWRMKNGTEMCVFNCGVDIFFVTMSPDKGTIVALGDKFGARKLIMLQVVRTKIKKIVSS